MRSREEVLREFLPENEWDDYDPQFVMELMADRIRELEAQLSAVVARETQRESGKSILRGIAAPEVYRG